MHFKMSSVKWRQFCLGLNVLIVITVHVDGLEPVGAVTSAGTVLTKYGSLHSKGLIFQHLKA